MAENKPEDKAPEQVSGVKTETLKLPDREPSWTPESVVMMSADGIRMDPLRCPGCDSTTYSMEGSYRRGFYNIVINGKLEKEEVVPDVFIDIMSITCPLCRVKFLIADDTTYKVYDDNRRIQNELNAVTRLVITGSGNKEHQC